MRAHKDTRMNTHGFGEVPIVNAYVQGPEFSATAVAAAVKLFRKTS